LGGFRRVLKGEGFASMALTLSWVSDMIFIKEAQDG
jgi:hypothetical protein